MGTSTGIGRRRMTLGRCHCESGVVRAVLWNAAGRLVAGAQRVWEGTMMDDPFGKIRTLTMKREHAQDEWRFEVMNLKAAGFSLRAIADAAGVSHDTVWKMR